MGDVAPLRGGGTVPGRGGSVAGLEPSGVIDRERSVNAGVFCEARTRGVEGGTVNGMPIGPLEGEGDDIGGGGLESGALGGDELLSEPCCGVGVE